MPLFIAIEFVYNVEHGGIFEFFFFERFFNLLSYIFSALYIEIEEFLITRIYKLVVYIFSYYLPIERLEIFCNSLSPHHIFDERYFSEAIGNSPIFCADSFTVIAVKVFRPGSKSCVKSENEIIVFFHP